MGAEVFSEVGEHGLTRRRLMALAGAAALTGSVSACTPAAERTERRRTPTPTVPLRGDVRLLVAAISAEEVLLGYCTALINRHPQLAGIVRPIRQRQQQHVDVLRSALRRLDPPAARRRVGVPARRTSAQATLVRMVDAARRERFEDCLAADSGPLARLLASAAAAHAVTADELQAQR